MDIRKYFLPVTAHPKDKCHRLDDTSWIYQGHLPQELMNFDFDALWMLHPEEFGEVSIHGKIIKTPRWSQNYMRPYWYTGMMHDALPLPEQFQPFLQWANSLSYGNFNHVLINYYLDGNHYIGKHSDNEKQIIPKSAIMSISLGSTRTFRVRSKDTNQVVLDIDMPNGSYLVMGGDMQRNYFHEVPKGTGQAASSIGRRINITMRQFR